MSVVVLPFPASKPLNQEDELRALIKRHASEYLGRRLPDGLVELIAREMKAAPNPAV